MNIYVGNIPYTISDDDLREKFSEFGEVADARIISDRETGRSKGFGFVEMPNKEEAESAISKLDGQDYSGRTIKVNEARPRKENRDRDRRPRY